MFAKLSSVLLLSLITCQAAVTVDGLSATSTTARKSYDSNTVRTIDGKVVNTALAASTQPNYTLPAYGYVYRTWEDGAYRYYVNGNPIDYAYIGGLKTITSNHVFDLGRIGQPGRSENSIKFGQIWQAFRSQYALNGDGHFVPSETANTPAHKLTLNEFAHYVIESRPTISITFTEKCARCSGKRTRTGLVGTTISEVPCEECNVQGSIVKQENYSLLFSGNPPVRPSLDELIKEGLVAPKKAPIAAAPMPAAAPRQNTPKQPVPEPQTTEPARQVELTPEQQFAAAKSKAEAGNAQAQYELGLFYAQDHERVVPLDYFEAFNWTQKAALKNHRLAQRQLGKFYEQGKGTEKNAEETIKWYRSSALLGCKQSQRWMGQIYHSTFQGSKVYEDFIKKDTSNLVEAYAWFMLGAERTIPARPDGKTPTPEELSYGPALSSRDYSFESSTQGACDSERDNIAKNPNFTRVVSEQAKARFIALKAEAEEYRKANKPK